MELDGTPRISLALVIHNHQPVGNFGWVFEDVHRAAYSPFLDLLTRHPGVRVGLHYTGPLLHWLGREHPEFVERVRALVTRGQVELLGGGLYEPVLASLPDRDRVGQLTRMAAELERLAGGRPRGAWLAERVWEPSLPTALADAGYEWTIVDDVHLRAAGIPDEEHWGTYTTDDQGRRITVFGTEQGLRYLVPFRGVDEVIDHLRAHATPDGTRLGTMGDDGEKFGAWPTTFEHCWGRGQWMERFFNALEENASWLTTVRPSDWIDRHPPVGRAYLPTSSYTEMTEWVLPPDDAILFAKALEQAKVEGRPEARFLRGGFWRNYQRRYREINDLHKQMLRTSAKVAAMPAGPARDLATDHLYQGQSNDCYWHGLFGGIYLSHMRLATYEHLIAAEDLADALAVANGQPAVSGRLADVDLDGVDEVLFESPGQVVVIKPSEGAAVASWDARGPRHALTAVLRRRPEAYHERLRAAARSGTLKVEGGEAAPTSAPATREEGYGEGHVESIHGIVQSKEPGLERLLVYDAYERRSGLVHLLDAGVSLQDLVEARAEERADVVDGRYEIVELGATRLVARRDGTARMAGAGAPQIVRVEKTYRLGGDRSSPQLALGVRLQNRSQEWLSGRLAVEWNTTFSGGGGNPAAFYEIDGERQPHDGRGELAEATRIVSGNTGIGLVLTTEATPPAQARWYAIETISNSESGFERVYQGSCLVLAWAVELAAGEHLEVEVRQALEVMRDRAAEEHRTADEIGTAGTSGQA